MQSYWTYLHLCSQTFLFLLTGGRKRSKKQKELERSDVHLSTSTVKIWHAFLLMTLVFEYPVSQVLISHCSEILLIINSINTVISERYLACLPVCSEINFLCFCGSLTEETYPDTKSL